MIKKLTKLALLALLTIPMVSFAHGHTTLSIGISVPGAYVGYGHDFGHRYREYRHYPRYRYERPYVDPRAVYYGDDDDRPVVIERPIVYPPVRVPDYCVDPYGYTYVCGYHYEY